MAQAKTIINKFGKITGWNSITVNMLGRDVEGITELNYSDTVEKENVYGAGAFPVGRGEGNYAATCNITLLHEEIVALQRALGPGQSLTDIDPFDINVLYESGGIMYKDRIRNCEFKGNARNPKQNDKSITNQFELICSHIDWNIV
ncbi:MAG: hypothetical protein LBN27_05910 [Prevotellaceae bacterium]|jgi:hypothetical protein|nr:hypothetical protein [Prevotellaceae bacterium]